MSPLALTTAAVLMALPLPAPRADFYLHPNITYLNTATLGPCPREVVQKATRDWELLESNPADEYFGMFTKNPFTSRQDAVRTQVVAYIGAKNDNVALVPSTTVALNTVADGLVSSAFLVDGDVVLTSDQEHAGGYVNWLHYANCTAALRAASWCSADGRASHRPVVLKQVAIPVAPASAAPSSAAEIVALFRHAMDAEPRTKVLALSHVTTTHGLTLPIGALVSLAHSRGALVVVDGAQAMGMKVNVSELGVDVYATSAHKWLLAPKGSGVLYVSPRARSLVAATLLDGGFGSYTAQTGTRPAHTIVGLGHVLDYLGSYGGPTAIGEYNLGLRAVAFDGLQALAAKHQKLEGLQVIGARVRDGPLASPILTFALPKPWTSHNFAQAMFARGFVVKQAGRSAAANEGGPTMPLHACRLSFHAFISADDVTRTLHAIENVLLGAPRVV